MLALWEAVSIARVSRVVAGPSGVQGALVTELWSSKMVRHRYKLACETSNVSAISLSSHPLSQRLREHSLSSRLILLFPIDSRNKRIQNAKACRTPINALILMIVVVEY